MTTAERRKTISDLKDAIESIDADLIGAREELKDAIEALKEIRSRIEGLKESRKWRVEAIKFLKASE